MVPSPYSQVPCDGRERCQQISLHGRQFPTIKGISPLTMFIYVLSLNPFARLRWFSAIHLHSFPPAASSRMKARAAMPEAGHASFGDHHAFLETGKSNCHAVFSAVSFLCPLPIPPHYTVDHCHSTSAHCRVYAAPLAISPSPVAIRTSPTIPPIRWPCAYRVGQAGIRLSRQKQMSGFAHQPTSLPAEKGPAAKWQNGSGSVLVHAVVM